MEAPKQPKVLNTKQDFDEFLYPHKYLAFLDILGFKALVKNNSHNQLVSIYDGLFTQQITSVKQFHEKMVRSKSERLAELYTDAHLQMVNISDSILIWTEHGQPSAIQELLFAVSTLLQISLLQGLPLRGCITRQPFSVIQSEFSTSIIGKGLVHAYEVEQTQQWAGCIIDEEIIKSFNSIQKIIGKQAGPNPFNFDNYTIRYSVPFKNKAGEVERKTVSAINWSAPVISEERIREAFDAHNKKDAREGSDTPQKIENTIEFHTYCLKYKEAISKYWEGKIEALERGSSNEEIPG